MIVLPPLAAKRPLESAPGSDPASPSAPPSDQLGVTPHDERTTRVLIIDDHAVLSGALALAIDANAGMSCVGTASALEAGVSLVARLLPDVLLLDVLLPDGDGIEAIPRILDASPATRVLILTGRTDVDVLARAAARGASGFLPKESQVGAILAAIRAAVTGEMLVDGATLAAVLGRLAAASRREAGDPGEVPELTRRETDVLGLMGVGHDPHAIAQLLGISIHTCRGYQKALMAKLGAHSQLEAVVIGTRKGIIKPLTRS